MKLPHEDIFIFILSYPFSVVILLHVFQRYFLYKLFRRPAYLCFGFAIGLFGIKTSPPLFFNYMIYSMLHLQREKKNLQDLNGVFVFNVAEREFLDRPTARLIKEFDRIEGKS